MYIAVLFWILVNQVIDLRILCCLNSNLLALDVALNVKRKLVFRRFSLGKTGTGPAPSGTSRTSIVIGSKTNSIDISKQGSYKEHLGFDQVRSLCT